MIGPRYLLVVLSIACHVTLAYAFTCSVAPPPRGAFRPKKVFSRLQASPLPTSPLDISGSLIAQLAEIAIRLRLADQTDVKCELSSTPSDLLLRGRIGPVTVKGKGWKSGRGLTCRAIEATVQSCELDMGRVVANQKLMLTTPAEGKAMIALNGQDFGNFITHPMLKAPQVTDKSTDRPVFLKDNAVIDPVAGAVVFQTQFADHTWKCTLQRGETPEGGPKIVVAPLDDSSTVSEELMNQLSTSLTEFFSKLVFELDGTFVSYKDMMVTEQGASPSVMLALDILVRKFPSPGLDF